MSAFNKLTAKQAEFVRAYHHTRNASEAARQAGYKGKNIAVTANEMLKRPKLHAALAELQSHTNGVSTIQLERVLQEIGRIAFSDMRGLFDPETGALLPPHEWPDNAAAAIAGFDVVTRKAGEGEVEYVAKVKTWDKGQALDKLMRYLGAYQDKLTVTHEVGERVASELQKGRERVASYKVIDDGKSDAA